MCRQVTVTHPILYLRCSVRLQCSDDKPKDSASSAGIRKIIQAGRGLELPGRGMMSANNSQEIPGTMMHAMHQNLISSPWL